MNFFDLPIKWQKGFQDPASPIMEGIIDLHNNIFFFLLFILGLVLYLFAFLIYEFSIKWSFPKKEGLLFHRKYFFQMNNLIHGRVLELVWTLIPSLILLSIAVPSFGLLYAMDEVIDPLITLKVIGHQWFWSYEFSDSFFDKNVIFDSYMIAENDLKPGQLRLLDVDNEVLLPVNAHVRFLVTSTDVLHSFAVPSLGLKVDAVPGRLNQLTCFIKRAGVFYGQCSELCGVNHGFMPIVIRSTFF